MPISACGRGVPEHAYDLMATLGALAVAISGNGHYTKPNNAPAISDNRALFGFV